MKLLLTEDDQSLGSALHGTLASEGYAVTWVRTAEDAWRFVQAESFDILLIDIVLPKASGLDLLRWVRARADDTPVLMLTARDSVIDRVLGLDSGADDYLPKPFSVSELLSRLRVLLRRRSGQVTAVWRVGDLVIDTVRRRVSISELAVSLSQREYEILLRMAKNPGHVFTRRQLSVGSEAIDTSESNAVDVHVHSLRRKICAKRITTVRGVGYLLEEE
jgi:two-component system, OmpR family, response regulator QseB